VAKVALGLARAPQSRSPALSRCPQWSIAPQQLATMTKMAAGVSPGTGGFIRALLIEPNFPAQSTAFMSADGHSAAQRPAHSADSEWIGY
jgi:hypothetical protein